MNNRDKIFIQLVEENLQEDFLTSEIWLITVTNKDGFALDGLLYIDDYSEDIDNHCTQCMNELLPLRLSHPELGQYIVLCMGPTKFNKILNHEFIFDYCTVRLETIMYNSKNNFNR